ncbi:MAG: hypothetical protein V1853_01100 [bacterium]
MNSLSDELIHRHMRVDRRRTSEQVIGATRRHGHVSRAALKTMPREGNQEEDIFFFKMPSVHDVGTDEVIDAYDRHGLEPDPVGVAKVNEDNPFFADGYPNVCLWQDSQGRWCYVLFCSQHSEFILDVDFYNGTWSGWRWWFGGRHKIAPRPSQ